MMTPAETITEPCRIAISDELARRGWTQADLARHIGMTQKHISQALTGKATAYGGLALMLYALGLEVTVGPGRMAQTMAAIESHFAGVDLEKAGESIEKMGRLVDAEPFENQVGESE